MVCERVCHAQGPVSVLVFRRMCTTRPDRSAGSFQKITASCALMQLLHVVKPLTLSWVFIETAEEHKFVAGGQVLWQCSKVRADGKVHERGKIILWTHCCRRSVKFQAQFEVACNFLLSVPWLRFAVLAVPSLATGVGGVAWRCIVRWLFLCSCGVLLLQQPSFSWCQFPHSRL